jgi:hypothetical protein
MPASVQRLPIQVNAWRCFRESEKRSVMLLRQPTGKQWVFTLHLLAGFHLAFEEDVRYPSYHQYIAIFPIIWKFLIQFHEDILQRPFINLAVAFKEYVSVAVKLSKLLGVIGNH